MSKVFGSIGAVLLFVVAPLVGLYFYVSKKKPSAAQTAAAPATKTPSGPQAGTAPAAPPASDQDNSALAAVKSGVGDALSGVLDTLGLGD